ncbi:MAG TPA: hypothetical protein VFN96_05645 [Gemmatimonadales bacterium]|nr:hypothetical protein [Gemmatimonadales bacterium]
MRVRAPSRQRPEGARAPRGGRPELEEQIHPGEREQEPELVAQVVEGDLLFALGRMPLDEHEGGEPGRIHPAGPGAVHPEQSAVRHRIELRDRLRAEIEAGVQPELFRGIDLSGSDLGRAHRASLPD